MVSTDDSFALVETSAGSVWDGEAVAAGSQGELLPDQTQHRHLVVGKKEKKKKKKKTFSVFVSFSCD